MIGYLSTVLIIGGIYALLTISLDLQYGFTGLVNFGQVAFFAIGAYASALITLAGYPIAAGFAAAIIVAAVSSIPIGLLALRLREDYLAIVTLGFSEVVRLILVNEEWLTKGSLGLPNIPRIFPMLTGPAHELAYLGLVIVCNVLVVLLIRHVIHSPFGRLIQAIRDDETAAVALGKHPPAAKMRAFAIGAAIAGLAGALYAHYLTYIVPDQFVPVVTFYVWMAMILGGTGSLRGALTGTTVLVFLLEGSRFIRDIFPGVLEVQMASIRLALIGLLIVLFTLYRPQGLAGRRQAK